MLTRCALSPIFLNPKKRSEPEPKEKEEADDGGDSAPKRRKLTHSDLVRSTTHVAINEEPPAQPEKAETAEMDVQAGCAETAEMDVQAGGAPPETVEMDVQVGEARPEMVEVGVQGEAPEPAPIEPEPVPVAPPVETAEAGVQAETVEMVDAEQMAKLEELIVRTEVATQVTPKKEKIVTVCKGDAEAVVDVLPDPVKL